MSTRRTRVPAIPPVSHGADAGAIKRSIDALKEAAEVGLGRVGDPLDRFVTVRELKDSGAVQVVIKGGAAAILPPGSGSPGAPIFTPGDPDFGGNDYTTPPAPTGVFARGVGDDSIAIVWNPPGYSNHAYAEVFGLLNGHLSANPFDAMISATPGFDRSRPASVNNQHARFIGSATGALLMHRGIVRMRQEGQSDLDAALNPTSYTYFVRFVSFAGVPGPFAPVPLGARGALTINPGEVLDALTENVTQSALYSRLQRIIQVSEQDRAALAASGNLTRMTLSATEALREDVTGLQGSVGDTSFLGINQTLSSVALTQQQTIESLWTVRMQTTVGDVRYAAGFGLGLTVDTESGTAQSDFIVSADRFSIIGVKPDGSTTAPSVPFIVDTQRNVVGIRGSLIVDGLVRATSADFNLLTAETAFIDQIRAESLNANVIVGNRIVAGMPAPDGGGSRIPEADLNAYSSNYVVELANPVVGPGVTRSPFRYYKPNAGGSPHVVAELTANGDFLLGGNLSVGKNATIATTSGTHVFSVGGVGIDTPQDEYALWIGPRSDFGTVGQGRSEANGLLWVRTNGRAGFNAEFFLGNSPFTLPSSASNGNGGSDYYPAGGGYRARSLVQRSVAEQHITIKAARNGTPVLTVFIVSGFLMSVDSGGDGDNKQMIVTAEVVGSKSVDVPAVATLQTMAFDDWQPETMPLCMIGSAELPAGNYYVRLRVETLQDRPMSIMDGWNVVAFQATSNAGLA